MLYIGPICLSNDLNQTSVSFMHKFDARLNCVASFKPLHQILYLRGAAETRTVLQSVTDGCAYVRRRAKLYAPLYFVAVGIQTTNSIASSITRLLRVTEQNIKNDN